MAAPSTALTREQLARAPVEYFAAIDAKDFDGALTYFADDATFTVQSEHSVFSGKKELAELFRGLFASFETMSHRVTNVVVDEAEGKVATEQSVVNSKPDGTQVSHYTCNFFAFAPDGRFSRVIIWIDGQSPMRK